MTLRGSSPSSALVLLMTPALALFFEGWSETPLPHADALCSRRSRSAPWTVCGYSLAFALHHGLIGSFRRWASATWSGRCTAPCRTSAFCAFQMMFAIITPALHLGRVRGAHALLGVHPLFIVLWSMLSSTCRSRTGWRTTVSSSSSGRFDFAGGTVIASTARHRRARVLARHPGNA